MRRCRCCLSLRERVFPCVAIRGRWLRHTSTPAWAGWRSKCWNRCCCKKSMSAIRRWHTWRDSSCCLANNSPNKRTRTKPMEPELYANSPAVGLLKGFSPVPHQLELDVVVPHQERSLPGFGEFLPVELGPHEALVGRVSATTLPGNWPRIAATPTWVT